MSGDSEPEVCDMAETSETLAKAAIFGNKEMLESLLENGADPNISVSNGNYPLHEAALHGETECASLLLAHKGKDGYLKLGRGVSSGHCTSHLVSRDACKHAKEILMVVYFFFLVVTRTSKS